MVTPLIGFGMTEINNSLDPFYARSVRVKISTVKEATQIYLRFDPTDDGNTSITLVHSGWDALGKVP